MTWGEFKAKVEARGIQDSDDIWYIDITFDEELEFKNEPNLGWSIS